MARTLNRIVITLPCAMLLALLGVASAQQPKALARAGLGAMQAGD